VGGSSGAAARAFSGIFAVGDNPAADVRGANSAGPPWVSVLVRTGVFQGPGANSTSDPAHVAVADALAAVEAALHRSRAARWHAMR
jgi:ribonucleotide monophosphatase NagD (HAD superfamily)